MVGLPFFGERDRSLLQKIGSFSRSLLLGIFFSISFLEGATITVDLSDTTVVADQPVEGVAIITHSIQEVVDPHSFTVLEEPIQADFVYERVHSSLERIEGEVLEQRHLVAGYRFRLPSGEAGDSLLPPIRVFVGGQWIESKPKTYRVVAERKDPFRLLAEVRGASSLYPGHRVELVYTLIGDRPLEVVAEEFPFFEATSNVRSLGHPILFDSHSSDPNLSHDLSHDLSYGSSLSPLLEEEESDERETIYVQKWVQSVALEQPGTIEYPAARVEGLTYYQDHLGRRCYDTHRIEVESPSITLEVTPFPSDDPTISSTMGSSKAPGLDPPFTGALGVYKITSRLLSDSQLVVGDRAVVEVTIQGEGEGATLGFPPLDQLSGFSDFRFNPLPLNEEKIPGGKRYILEVRPLSDAVSCIPSIAFRSFDPVNKKYVDSSSLPIPLWVASLEQKGNTMLADDLLLPTSKEEERSLPTAIPLRFDEIQDHRPPWGLLGWFPIVGGAIGLQLLWRHRRQSPSKPSLSKQLCRSILVVKGEVNRSRFSPFLDVKEGSLTQLRQLFMTLLEVQAVTTKRASPGKTSDRRNLNIRRIDGSLIHRIVRQLDQLLYGPDRAIVWGQKERGEKLDPVVAKRTLDRVADVFPDLDKVYHQLTRRIG